MKKLSLTTLALAFAVAPAFSQTTDYSSVLQNSDNGNNVEIIRQAEDGSRDEEGFVRAEQDNHGQVGDNILKVEQNQGVDANGTDAAVTDLGLLAPSSVDFTQDYNIAIVRQEQPDANAPGGNDPELSVLLLEQIGHSNILMGARANPSSGYYHEGRAAGQRSINGSNFMRVNQLDNENQVGITQLGTGDHEAGNPGDYQYSIFNNGFDRPAFGDYVGNINSHSNSPYDPSNFGSGTQNTLTRYSNLTDIEQTGSNNQLQVRQKGEGNTPTESVRNELHAVQGGYNQASVLQKTETGMNSTEIVQGEFNELHGASANAGADPFTTDPAAYDISSSASQIANDSGNNIMRVAQDDHNIAGLYQESNASLGLSDLANQAYITQSGGFNNSFTYQTGMQNYAEVVQ